MDARTFIDGTLKKAAPALVGVGLIAAQQLSGAAAEDLVVPLAVAAVCGALATLPLVVRIATVHAALSSDAARERLRTGIWGMVLGLRKADASEASSAGTTGAAPAPATEAPASTPTTPLVVVPPSAQSAAGSDEGTKDEDDSEWDDEEFEALEHNSIVDVVGSPQYARAAHRRRAPDDEEQGGLQA